MAGNGNILRVFVDSLSLIWEGSPIVVVFIGIGYDEDSSSAYKSSSARSSRGLEVIKEKNWLII